jgi:hypothetical protein
MNRWLLLAAVLPLLAACASIPEPEGPEDSLVIGYFALDFPDGFFDQNRRTITNGITLSFVNERSGNKFSVMTSQGYYQFLSNGTDSYSFAGFKIRVDRGTIQSNVNQKFAAKPHSVVYLGHLTVIYAKPQKTHEVSMDMKTHYWDYDISTNFTYNEGELQSYLKSRDPENPWLEYEVVH